MRLHQGQRSILEVDNGPTESLPDGLPGRSRTRGTYHGRAAATVSSDPPDGVHEPADAERSNPGAPVTDKPQRARRRTRKSSRATPERCPGETLEKHYKTRDVADLLSVHEETVLRLAQCGHLRSVRVGAERRYPESAIVEFLEGNVDETPRRVNVMPRRASSARGRTGKATR
jgi:excisionase family DNA binding protein